ncbi:MAG: cupin domain-containing protein, partial [Peptococcus niger]
IKGHAVNLAEAMDWAEGEVNSMTICQCPEISLTTFALAEGTRIGAHKSSGDALVMVLEGTAEITVGEATYQVKAGESLVMPAEIPHALKASEAFKMFLLVAF